MTINEILRLHQTRPFKPFAVFLPDGRSLAVRHPENLSYSEKGRTVHVYDDSGTAEIVDLFLVVSLKPLSH
jgi:hypothetical protein